MSNVFQNYGQKVLAYKFENIKPYLKDCMMKISHSAGLVKLLDARISLQIGKQKTNMDIAPFIKEPVLFNQNQGGIKKNCFLFSELFPKIGTFLAFLQTSNFYLKD